MRAGFRLLPVIVVVFAACASDTTAPVAQQRGFSIPFPDGKFIAEPEENAQAGAPDYASVLKRAASRDRQALERLFAITAAGHWDAAGAEFHDSHMREILAVWGDTDFSRVLSRQPFGIRRAVGRSLSWPEESEFREHFPLTHAVTQKA
jgi:hypothetical protein